MFGSEQKRPIFSGIVAAWKHFWRVVHLRSTYTKLFTHLSASSKDEWLYNGLKNRLIRYQPRFGAWRIWTDLSLWISNDVIIKNASINLFPFFPPQAEYRPRIRLVWRSFKQRIYCFGHFWSVYWFHKSNLATAGIHARILCEILLATFHCWSSPGNFRSWVWYAFNVISASSYAIKIFDVYNESTQKSSKEFLHAAVISTTKCDTLQSSASTMRSLWN